MTKCDQERRPESKGSYVPTDSFGSNKPMVPTATTWLDDDSSGPLRRHIGRPFGSGERRPNGQRVTATAPRGEQESGQRQETTSCV